MPAAGFKLIFDEKIFGPGDFNLLDYYSFYTLLNNKEIAIDCTKSWYNEAINTGYNYANANYSPENSHFTQLVWKSSTRVGLGLSMSKYNEQFNAYYCVAQYSLFNINYSTTGSVLDAFKANVLAPLY